MSPTISLPVPQPLPMRVRSACPSQMLSLDMGNLGAPGDRVQAISLSVPRCDLFARSLTRALVMGSRALSEQPSWAAALQGRQRCRRAPARASTSPATPMAATPRCSSGSISAASSSTLRRAVMPRSPASSKASCAASPCAATSRRASSGRLAASAATSCGCPSRVRVAASARRAWAGGWPRGRRSWSTTFCLRSATASGCSRSRGPWPSASATTASSSRQFQAASPKQSFRTSGARSSVSTDSPRSRRSTAGSSPWFSASAATSASTSTSTCL